MDAKIKPIPLGYAAGIISAVVMLLLGIGGNLGIYMGAVEMMQRWHLLFSSSILGIILGMLEAAVISFILAYSLAWLYNYFL